MYLDILQNSQQICSKPSSKLLNVTVVLELFCVVLQEQEQHQQNYFMVEDRKRVCVKRFVV